MADVARGRLLPSSSTPDVGERVEEIVSVANVVVKQILSAEQDVPADYLQQWDELVVVLAGAAVLEIDGEHCDLRAGEWALLPARIPHRLVSTSSETNWLVVHVYEPGLR
ncbi:MAG: cupin domain-containing protein [Acidimicrobiia bacterium]|nr:cupin domain-containing protein [Acidimicrobiia bacterium]